MCADLPINTENKCYFCGRTEKELPDLNPSKWLLRTMEDNMEISSRKLCEASVEFIDKLESITKANRKSSFLDFTVEALENDFHKLLKQIPFLGEILDFKSSGSQKLSEIIENLINLKKVVEDIKKDPQNPGQHLGRKFFEEKPNSLVNYYFEKLMPPETTKDERRTRCGGEIESFRKSKDLQTISNLIYQVELCKHTIENLRKHATSNHGSASNFTFTYLNLDDMFPNFKQNVYIKEILSEYTELNYDDELRGTPIKVPICIICSSILKKYTDTYETKY